MIIHMVQVEQGGIPDAPMVYGGRTGAKKALRRFLALTNAYRVRYYGTGTIAEAHDPGPFKTEDEALAWIGEHSDGYYVRWFVGRVR